MGEIPMSVDRLPNESAEYRRKRAELLAAEIALKDQIERVAALRRELPGDTLVERDYVFQQADLVGGGEVRDVRLSELFDDPAKPLVLVHFMFGKKQERPCPMCTLWADGYDGIVPHLRQRAAFGVVVAGDVAAFREYARGRGWRHLRLLSAGDSSFKRDFRTESADGAQEPAVSVFSRVADGRARHVYTASAMMAEGHWRGMDLLCPLWNFLDLLPEGRGSWMPRVRYD
jgi:predicted dithiol-disulfide oxidoreductase (DUF899 family)